MPWTPSDLVSISAPKNANKNTTLKEGCLLCPNRMDPLPILGFFYYTEFSDFQGRGQMNICGAMGSSLLGPSQGGYIIWDATGVANLRKTQASLIHALRNPSHFFTSPPLWMNKFLQLGWIWPMNQCWLTNHKSQLGRSGFVHPQNCLNAFMNPGPLRFPFRYFGYQSEVSFLLGDV